MIGIILAIITAVSGALDLDVLLDKSAEKKLRIKSWIKLGLLLLATIFTMRKEYIDGIEKEDTIKAEKIRDSINASNYISDLKNYNLMHSKDLKESQRKNSDSLKSFSENIIKLLADYNLKYDTTNNQIKKAIQLVNSKEPAISAPRDSLHQLIKYRMEGDTVKLQIKFANYSEAAANDVDMDIYFITKRDGLFYSTTVWASKKWLFSGNQVSTAYVDLISKNFLLNVKNFYFVLTGDYKTNSGKIKKICMLYKFSEDLGKFINDTNSDRAMEILKNSIKY